MSDALFRTICAQVNAQVDVMCDKAGQLSLGELLARLEALDPELPVFFTFDGQLDGVPADYHSYRGYYRFIALARYFGGYEDGTWNYLQEGMTVYETVGKLAEATREAIGKTYVGWKGGNFTMSRRTPVWVSQQGGASGMGIVDVVEKDGWGVELVTKLIEEDWV